MDINGWFHWCEPGPKIPADRKRGNKAHWITVLSNVEGLVSRVPGPKSAWKPSGKESKSKEKW